MSERRGDERARNACDRYAPTLAMLDAPTLDADERRAALAHLAGCERCQADQRAYAQLDTELRRAFGPAAAAPQSTADLLAAIGATREPHSRTTMRSVVDLGHLDDTGRMDGMQDTDRRDDVGASAHDRAPIPALRPGVDARLGRRRWTAGFGAVAVALVVIVLAATLFNMRPHGASTSPTLGPAATQTAQAQSYVGAANDGPIETASMDSSTDGWAIGQPGDSDTPPTPSGAATVGAVFYHFNGSAWIQAVSVAGFAADGGVTSPYIKMFSPTDGWAYDGDRHLLRYDGKAWRAATINLSGSEQVAYVQTLDMVSPTDGWAAALLKSGMVGFLHFDGQRWTLDRSDISTSGGGSAIGATSQLIVTGISEAPGGDVWAVGTEPYLPNLLTGNDALYFHRVSGVWVLTFNQNCLLEAPYAACIQPSLVPHGIYLGSPTSGWLVGEVDQNKTTSEGSTTVAHAMLMRYESGHWTNVTVPRTTATNYDVLQKITGTGPNDIWISGVSSARAVTSTGLEISSLLLHYDGHSWSQVTPNIAVSGISAAEINSVSLAPDGALWAVGWVTLSVGLANGSTSPLFWRYRDGVWSAFPVTSGA